jgi:SAM-dependent methyltransferase
MPTPNRPSIKEIFDDPAHARYFDQFRRLDDGVITRWVSLIGQLCQHSPHLIQLLDVGCGTGRFSLPFCQYAFSVTGLDTSAAMVSLAIDNAHALQITNFNPIISSFEAYSPLLSFDILFISELVHLVEDKFVFFNRTFSLLSSNGFIVVRTPSHAQLRARDFNSYFPGLVDIELLRHLDIDQYMELLLSCGFLNPTAKEIDESDSLLAAEYIDALRHRFHSTFFALDENSFDAGLAAAERTLRGIVSRNLPITMITAQRP